MSSKSANVKTVMGFWLSATLLALGVAVPTAVHAAANIGDKFGDWVFECQAIADGKTDCALTQTLVNKQTNQPVIRLILARSKGDDDVDLKVLVPLGIDLEVGVSGSVDDKVPIKVVVETCVQAGCLGSAKAKGGIFDAIKGGTALNLTFTGKGAGNKVSVAGSLKGAADGIAAAGFRR